MNIKRLLVFTATLASFGVASLGFAATAQADPSVSAKVDGISHADVEADFFALKGITNKVRVRPTKVQADPRLGIGSAKVDIGIGGE